MCHAFVFSPFTWGPLKKDLMQLTAFRSHLIIKYNSSVLFNLCIYTAAL